MRAIFEKQITLLNERIEKMKQYLLLKFEEEDWHGVCDAGMDIRDLESERKVYLDIIACMNIGNNKT